MRPLRPFLAFENHHAPKKNAATFYFNRARFLSFFIRRVVFFFLLARKKIWETPRRGLWKKKNEREGAVELEAHFFLLLFPLEEERSGDPDTGRGKGLSSREREESGP